MSDLESKLVCELAARLHQDPSFGPGGMFEGCGFAVVLLEPTERKTFVGSCLDERSKKLFRCVVTALTGLLRASGDDSVTEEEQHGPPIGSA